VPGYTIYRMSEISIMHYILREAPVMLKYARFLQKGVAYKRHHKLSYVIFTDH